MDSLTHIRIDRKSDRQTREQTDGQMDKQTDGQTDRWTNRQAGNKSRIFVFRQKFVFHLYTFE